MSASAPSRRSVLQGLAVGAAGVAAASAPVRWFDAEAAAAPAADGIFGYGVASGDPLADAVVIWTRATPDPTATPGSGQGAPLEVTWQVARDSGFTAVVRSGTVTTSPASDHTVKVDVTGLAPYTRYYYRFTAVGEASRTGRTQTAQDDGAVHALRFALVSCSNYTGGYFGAYKGIAERTDLDFVLHVGDYIYEYGEGPTAPDRYGPAGLEGVRDGVPAAEIESLQDYRLRHALHKADRDQQAAHQQLPWITIFDDHEVCNNTWATGAENHTPGTGTGGEGDFAARKARAYQAYLEWMPFRLPDQTTTPHQGTQFFKRFSFGPLADLSVLETRQNRSEQIDDPGKPGQRGGGFIPEGTTGLADTGRHLPEPEQMTWLRDGIDAAGTTWHLLGNQVVLAPVRYPASAVGSSNGTSATNPYAFNSDQWDGYQADQAQIIAAFGAAPAAAGDVVVLTGDIHSSWAIEVPATHAVGDPRYTSVAVEIVCPSVTSDGFVEVVAAATSSPSLTAAMPGTRALTAGLQTLNPWIKYLDGVGHGWTLIDVTPARVQADFYLTPIPTPAQDDPRTVDPDTTPSVVPAYATSYQTLATSKRVTTAPAAVGPRSDSPAEFGPTASLPEHVGPAALAVVGAAAVVWSRRRARVAAAEGGVAQTGSPHRPDASS